MTETDADTRVRAPESTGSGNRWLVVAVATLLVLVAVALLVWLLAVRDDDSGTTTTKKTNAVAATQQELKQVAAEVGHPVYWAGPAAGRTYELTRTRDGRIFIRYLPEGTDVGDPRPKFTTVGTYPSPTAFATLERGAKRKDATAYRFQSGAIAVTYAKTPSSVYFAFPTSPYLVEVFDPSPARAVKLVTSGQVKLIK
jgi:hypothetical protein